jgi:hypothetical protein
LRPVTERKQDYEKKEEEERKKEEKKEEDWELILTEE